MADSFVEIKLFQVKPDKTEQFEALIKQISAEQKKWELWLKQPHDEKE